MAQGRTPAAGRARAAATRAPAGTKAPAKKAATKAAKAAPKAAKAAPKAATKAPAKKAPAKAAAKAPAKKTPARKVPAQAAAKAPAKKAPAKATTKKAPVKKAPVTKAPVTKAPAKAPAKAPVPKAAAKAPAKPAPARAAAKAPAKKAPAKKAPAKRLVVRDDESPWTAKELAEVRHELDGEVARLNREIAAAEEGLADLLRDSGDGAGDDQADAGTKTFEREHEMSLANNARDMHLQTERALRRLDDGTYGVCESCGNPIGKGRLQAFPRATLCLSCKQREERR